MTTAGKTSVELGMVNGPVSPEELDLVDES